MQYIILFGGIVMSLVMVHLTDLHLDRHSAENVRNKYESIANACYSVIHDGDDVLILFTGDITNRGHEDEFLLFNDIISNIISKIENEKAVQVHFACVPGNHDCTFSINNNECAIEIEHRDNLMKKIKENNFSLYVDDINKYVQRVQKNYRTFVSKYGYKVENCLVDSLLLNLNCGKIKIYMINTAWSSKPKEKPTELNFPLQYVQNLKNDADLSLVLCHHPYSWFDRYNSVLFEKQLRLFADILFLGHEHRFDKVEAGNSKWNYLKLNGEELQNSKNTEMSKFAVYVLSGKNLCLSSDEIRFQQFDFVWSADSQKGIYMRTEHRDESFHKNRSHINSLYLPNDKFQIFLNDLGMSVKHYRIGDLKLSDIYCSPELHCLEIENTDYFLNNTIIKDPFSEIKNNDMTLIAGEAMSGKSTLAKSLYTEFNKCKFCCLFLDASEITSCKESTLEKLIDSIFKEQYDGELINNFQQLEKDSKAVIIDNIQNFKLSEDSRSKLFVFLHKYFSKIVAFSSIDFDNLLMISDCVDLGIERYAMYKIKPLSKVLRLNLIKKWHNLGIDSTHHEDDIQFRVETSTKIIDNVLNSRSQLVPSYPMNIIFLLYTEASGLPANIQISQYGFLYETLVNKSLSFVPNITSDKVNICVGFLSEVAYYMLNTSMEGYTYSDIQNLTHQYKLEKMVDFNSIKLINDMLECNILVKNDDKIRFKYPYIYYYFVSRYIVNNMKSSNVKKKVEEMCSCLYNESYGNIMIFVCHFANNDEIIDNILINAFDILPDAEQFDFSQKQTKLLADVNKKIDVILSNIEVGEEKDVKFHREERLTIEDDIAISDISKDESSAENKETSYESTDSLYSSMKIIMVLGQILKNYPGDLSGERKVEMIEALHSLGMRVVGDMFITVAGYVDPLIDYLIKLVRNESCASTLFEISQGVKNLVGGMLSNFAMLMIHLIAISFGSEYAVSAAEKAIGNSVSGKLVMYDIEMNCLSKPRFSDLEKLFNDLKKQGLDFAALTLKFITHEYLKFNKCGTAKRDHLCSLMGFKKQNLLIDPKE